MHMSDKDLEKAADRIWKKLEPIAVASFGGGTGILVVDESGIRSRAQRAEMVREAAGRHGVYLDFIALSPEEISDLKGMGEESGIDIGYILSTSKVLRGSMDGILRRRKRFPGRPACVPGGPMRQSVLSKNAFSFPTAASTYSGTQ